MCVKSISHKLLHRILLKKIYKNCLSTYSTFIRIWSSCTRSRTEDSRSLVIYFHSSSANHLWLSKHTYQVVFSSCDESNVYKLCTIEFRWTQIQWNTHAIDQVLYSCLPSIYQQTGSKPRPCFKNSHFVWIFSSCWDFVGNFSDDNYFVGIIMSFRFSQ